MGNEEFLTSFCFFNTSSVLRFNEHSSPRYILFFEILKHDVKKFPLLKLLIFLNTAFQVDRRHGRGGARKTNSPADKPQLEFKY